jgi:ubiquinone/menaquinone biosynthesis C-methylase UbiE
VEDKEVVKEAFSKLAPHYEETVHQEIRYFYGWGYSDFIQFLVEQTDIQSGDLILDIATGTGVIPRTILKNRQDCRIVGLDITRAMLIKSKAYLGEDIFGKTVSLTTGNAMQIPLKAGSFDLIVSGLATHHMQIDLLVSEIYRTLKENGRFSMVDVGGSKLWKNPIVLFLIRLTAFAFYLISENKSRAWAEASSVGNIYTAEDWHDFLKKGGFEKIIITQIKSNRFWAPNPLLIQAIKQEKRSNE